MTDRVYMRHIREAGFCAGGLRYWCKLHGIDIRQISDGYPIEELKKIDCDRARRVIEVAEAER